MLVNRRILRIEWGQCDPAGLEFYPQYLVIFDSSTGWLFERTGLKPLAMRSKIWNRRYAGRRSGGPVHQTISFQR
jgi:acyl-CoA thioesterase FadM